MCIRDRSNFDVPQYEEITGYSNKWQLAARSASATPRIMEKRGQIFEQIQKDRPRIPSGSKSAFQGYTSTRMSALNNPWKPFSRGTATPVWGTVPPLVYLSTPGTPVGRPQTEQEPEEKQVRMNFSAVDKTVLIPKGRSETAGATSPIKFTKELQNGDACLLYTSPSPRDATLSRMPSSA